MPRIQNKTEERRESLNIKIYSNKELYDLGEELKKYIINKEFLIKGEKVSITFVPVSGVDQWYKDKGAASNTIDFRISNIFLYKELREKLEQYYAWERKKEYAIKMSINDYSDLAEEIVNTVVIINDEIPF
jgi:hypothetical protein